MKRKIWVVWGCLLAAVIGVNILAWRSKAFCDWHIKNLFPISVNTWGRVMSLFPFSVGEWMIAFGILLVVEMLALSLALIFVRKQWLRLLCRRFYTGAAWIFLFFAWVMTFNCFILYHGSKVDEKYMPETTEKIYGKEELALVRDHIVEQLNALTQEMERDSKGYLAYDKDISEGAVAAMERLGTEFGQLDGYYPQPKEIHSSDLLSQEYMMGYYFPFSMEANYNKTMYVINKPATMCHELAHLKGFIYEDDANFIGFLACIESDDPFFCYSGYMSVLSYVEKDFRESIHKDKSVYLSHPVIVASVYGDDQFLTQEAWGKVEEKAVIQTAVVKKASNQFTETTLKLNGVQDGMKSYSRVVTLLLKYYDGILY